MEQLSFASLDWAAKKKRTTREVFLAEMAAVVPWAKLGAVIEPHYPKRRLNAWQDQLFSEAQAINLGFALPLSFAEVRQIARSVARWTWGRFSEARFSEIQSRRGVRGGIKSGAHRSQRAEAAADVVLALIVDPAGPSA
jgi:hypothetical protein